MSEKLHTWGKKGQKTTTEKKNEKENALDNTMEFPHNGPLSLEN